MNNLTLSTTLGLTLTVTVSLEEPALFDTVKLKVRAVTVETVGAVKVALIAVGVFKVTFGPESCVHWKLSPVAAEL
jgi:hypothetical protein